MTKRPDSLYGFWQANATMANTPAQQQAARLAVCGRADSSDDARHIMSMLGLIA